MAGTDSTSAPDGLSKHPLARRRRTALTGRARPDIFHWLGLASSTARPQGRHAVDRFEGVLGARGPAERRPSGGAAGAVGAGRAGLRFRDAASKRSVSRRDFPGPETRRAGDQRRERHRRRHRQDADGPMDRALVPAQRPQAGGPQPRISRARRRRGGEEERRGAASRPGAAAGAALCRPGPRRGRPEGDRGGRGLPGARRRVPAPAGPSRPEPGAVGRAGPVRRRARAARRRAARAARLPPGRRRDRADAH